MPAPLKHCVLGSPKGNKGVGFYLKNYGSTIQ